MFAESPALLARDRHCFPLQNPRQTVGRPWIPPTRCARPSLSRWYHGGDSQDIDALAVFSLILSANPAYVHKCDVTEFSSQRVSTWVKVIAPETRMRMALLCCIVVHTELPFKIHVPYNDVGQILILVDIPSLFITQANNNNKNTMNDSTSVSQAYATNQARLTISNISYQP